MTRKLIPLGSPKQWPSQLFSHEIKPPSEKPDTGPCEKYESESGICYRCHYSWRIHPQYVKWMGQPQGKEWRDIWLRRQEDHREANEREKY